MADGDTPGCGVAAGQWRLWRMSAVVRRRFGRVRGGGGTCLAGWFGERSSIRRALNDRSVLLVFVGVVAGCAVFGYPGVDV